MNVVRCTFAVLLAATVPVGAAEAKRVGRTRATSAPAPATSQTSPAPKFQLATPEEIEAFGKQAAAYAEQTRKTITANLHKLETRPFVIYSAWSRSNDRALAEICEKLYVALCRQFDVPPTANIWAGKCPVFVFWDKEHFRRFTTEVDEVGMTDAAGYQLHRSDGFGYIVLNRVSTRRRFFELLAHEGTHAFIARYLTNLPIPSWVNEGMAEYAAATLVKGSVAARRHVPAARKAVQANKDISHVFTKPAMSDFDYGICQSLVRYLIARDRKAFVRFFTRMKEGASQAEALQEAYGLTGGQLLAQWRAAVARAIRAR